MRKMKQFKENLLSVYREIHGDSGVVTGEENHMLFHGTQRPYEFFRAWKIIQSYFPKGKNVSFLEIGAAKGLWSIAFIEMCKLYNKVPTYVTVTLLDAPGLFHSDLSWNPTLKNVKEYYKDQCKDWVLLDENSQTEEAREKVIGVLPKYDFVFIDADHSYAGVYKDVELYSSLADSLLIFHDIGPPYGDSVVRAINEHEIRLDHKIIGKGSAEGIGIHIKDKLEIT